MNDISLEIDETALEPKDYFKVLKGKLNSQTEKDLTNQLNVLAEHILAAKKINQKKFLEKLSFTYQTILKEQILLAAGFSKFVYKDDIKDFIDKVKPAKSVKIIELERFPRAIPLSVMENIKKVQDLEIFSGFVVVFTDFTDSDHSTKKEREVIQRNRDPIVFGYFKSNPEDVSMGTSTGLTHERFYFVDDWEDEFCDLTFAKMVAKMSESGVHMERTISTEYAYLNEIVTETLEEMKPKVLMVPSNTPRPSIWQKFVSKWKA